ncbi:MAG: divalent-cation tolerance protein CutA [bacterium]|jgi:periplasmic divalent cation tolerance protein
MAPILRSIGIYSSYHAAMVGAKNMAAGGSARVVLITAPDTGSAAELADTLVGEGLAACVNILPGVTSVYRWQGEVKTDAEVLLWVKTAQASLEALAARVAEVHPFDVPCIVALEPQAVGVDYLAWLLECCAGDSR